MKTKKQKAGRIGKSIGKPIGKPIPYELLAAVIFVIISFAISIYLYPIFPEKVASHWNVAGEVDGYMPKFWGLFLMPILSVVMLVLFVLIPYIDPLKKNIEGFRKYYNYFILLLIVFLFYLFCFTVLWNLGIRFNMVAVLAPAFAILFFYCGILVENAKRNWFIGIRTPWTLSDDVVWEKTHKVGGGLFKLAGVISLLGIFFQNYAIYFIIIPVILVAIYTIVFSYVEYQKRRKKR